MLELENKRMLGQYFTHPTVAAFMGKLMSPTPEEKIIDPACGDGEFLFHLSQLEPNAQLYGCEIDEEVHIKASERLPNAHIYLHNGLYSHSLYENESDITDVLLPESFDGIIANPPFNGLKNKVTQQEILSLFEMSYKDSKIRKTQSIEILFIERFIQLLKPSGRLCMILPEGILSDQRLNYLRDWLFEHINVEAIISLPKKGVFGNAYVNAVIVCGHKKPSNSKRVFFVRDTNLEELDSIYEYMKRSKIFIS